MPYQKIPAGLRPMYLKTTVRNTMKRHELHLNTIRAYPNSHYLLKNVESLQLTFKAHNAYGHQGAKLFWRNNLRTLQFHNPTLPISVQRIECETKEEQQKCPSVLTVKLTDGQVKKIDCKNEQHETIMEKLLAEVDAELVEV